MPYTINSPPRPAKNWTSEEQHKCVRAANAVLKRGGSEQDAIFACIHAAGRSKKETDEMSNARERRREKRKAERDALRTMTDEQVEEIVAEIDQKETEKEATEEEEKDFVTIQGEVVEQYIPFGGAKSWEELDDYLDARDLADATRQATYEFEKLINNILNDSEPSLSDKSSAISALAEGLPARVEMEIEDEMVEKGIIEKALDMISGKAAMETSSVNDLPDSDFAYIEPGGKKDEGGKTIPRSLRYYPIHDTAHIRNALARAAQMMKRGGKPGQIAKKAMPKIRAAAKREGIGAPAKSMFKVYKDKQGNHRWIGFVTNKWRDRDTAAAPEKGGEILSEESHKDMVGWANSKQPIRMPWLRAWHDKNHQCESRCDFIEYENGFVIASGPLTEQEAKSIEKVAEKYDMGMSHGLYALERDKEDGSIITKYRTFEVSYLPLEHAANPWTDFVMVEKEKEMDDEKKRFLSELMGEEFVGEIIEETEGKAAQLEELGVESKAKKPKIEETPKADPQPSDPPDYKAIADEIAKSIGIDELNKFIETLETSVKEINAKMEILQKTDDEKIAETLSPRIDVEKVLIPIWKRRQALSEENIVDEEKDKELLKGPGTSGGSWVSEVMGQHESAPVPK